MASLYFGIATLEAFLNQKMRMCLQGTKSEGEVLEVLRKGRIMTKLKEWPTELLGKPLKLNDGTLALIVLFNDVRGDLTHPKTRGHDVYARLETIDPISVIDSVAEYIVRFHEAEGTRFPYWLFGWNYLNPRSDSHEIVLSSDDQFCYSLIALGFNVPPPLYSRGESWHDEYLRTFEAYKVVGKHLRSLDRCEPKELIFPFKPMLCRRWWTSAHHETCGHVTDEAVEHARKHGGLAPRL